MLLKIYPTNPNQQDVNKIIEILSQGGLIIYPTDTVYAMGCNALDTKAIEKICKLKRINPEKNNLSIICYNLSEVSEYAKIENNTFKLMKKNLPGPFTFILKTNSNLPKIYKNKKTVGIRVPDNNIIQTIVKKFGHPILTTSIKDDDSIIEYTTDPELIHEKYKNIVDIVIDGGYGNIEPSTIVDCTNDIPIIKRQGIGKLIL